MTHEGPANLISLGLSPNFQGDDSSILRWMGGSLAIHALLIIFLTTLRFSPSFEKPLHSYEVSLINLSDVEAPSAKSKIKTKPRKARPAAPSKPKTRPPEPKAEVLPPLSTQASSERLSESFSGAVQSVVVPNQLSPQPKPPTEPVSTATTQTEPPLPPAPSNLRQETRNALQAIKAPPEAPTLKSIQPFRRTERKDTPDPDSLKQTIQSFKVPTPRTKAVTKKIPAPPKSTPVIPSPQTHSTPEAPQLPQFTPTKKKSRVPQVEQERLADSLKQVLDTVKIPKLRKVPLVESPQQEALKPKSPVSPAPNPPLEPDTTRTQKLRTEIDQQLAKLKIPEVAPIESLKERLQVQVVAATEPGEAPSSSTSSNTTRNAPGQNRYLALIEAKIEQKWVAPRVSLAQDHPQVILKFRVLQSGEVTNLGIKQGSGNGYYDAAAQRAVKAASPLPPFPKDLKSSYLDVLYKFRIGESIS